MSRPGAGDLHADAIGADDRLTLADGDLDPLDPWVAEGDLGEHLGDPLDQLEFAALEGGDHLARDPKVDRGVHRVVGARGRQRRAEERDVGAEEAWDRPLLGDAADPTRELEAFEEDPIHRRRIPSGARPRQAARSLGYHAAMRRYQVGLTARFDACHAVRFADGSSEPTHTHQWRIQAFFGAATLNDWEVIADFRALQAIVDDAVRVFEGTDLNDHPAFAGHNPTAERVAEVIHRRVVAALPSGVRLDRLHLWRAGGIIPDAEYVYSDSA